MTMDDLAAYEVLWSDPVVADYAGHRVLSHGLPATGGVNTAEALNVLEAADIKAMGHYTESPEALFWLTQLTRLSMVGYLFPHLADEVPGVDMSLEGRLGKAHGRALWARCRPATSPSRVPRGPCRCTPTPSPPSTSGATCSAWCTPSTP